MDKKIAKKLSKLDRSHLRAFVLERRDEGDHEKLEQQAYALDLLIEEAAAEGYREGKYSIARLF